MTAHVASMMWRRLDAPGHDACNLSRTHEGWRLEGAAVFRQGSDGVWLAYQVDCDDRWITRRGSVRGWMGSRAIDMMIVRDSAGRWHLGNRFASEFEGCLDLDLGFTPATNLLQLRRIALDVGQSADVPVAWLDVDSHVLEVVEQRYERRTPQSYWYESPRFRYAALLEVNEADFVTKYPDLWEAES